MICDQRALAGLLGRILQRSGLTVAELSRRMGFHDETVRQYFTGRRQRPSLLWFLKVAELCGCRVFLEFPTRRVR